MKVTNILTNFHTDWTFLLNLIHQITNVKIIFFYTKKQKKYSETLLTNCQLLYLYLIKTISKSLLNPDILQRSWRVNLTIRSLTTVI